MDGAVRRAVGHATIKTLVLVGVCLAVIGCAPVVPAQIGAEEAAATRTPAPTLAPTAVATETPLSTGTERYINRAYGFSFAYPSGWELIEGRNYVSLSQDATTLVIGYRHGTEDPNICCPESLPEGELVEAAPVVCGDEEIGKTLLRCEGKTKAVVYGGSREISLGELRFVFYVEDFRADYDAANIPPEVQGQVDDIIESLRTFQAAQEFSRTTPKATKFPPTQTPTREPSPVPPSPTPNRAVAVVQPRGANVRSGPGTDYGLEGELAGGQEVEITGRHGDWWRIGYGLDGAWVYDGVVAARETDGVPTVKIIPTPVPPSPSFIPTAAPSHAISEKRWIDVDLSEQRLRAYEDGEVVRTTLVSTGLPDSPTVRGQYRNWIKLRYDDMEGPDYYLEDVPYAMYFYQGYGLHGTFWHNNFGHRMSHGCVNLPTEEAAWVFDFVDVGTLVNVHE